jgi:3-hydroxyacyl-CoA dehydrogenase
MGTGIAAHLANLGFDVDLLDTSIQRSVEGLERAKSQKPPHFLLPDRADRIRIGDLRDHLEWVRQADWVCEAVVEKLDVKRALYAQIEPLLAPDAMISTNTSGLEIALLAEGRSPSFRKRFLGTHFFNPPRYLKLLELIPSPETDPAEVPRVTRLLENQVARRVVPAKDTPGFIANRFGMWAMFHAVHVAERLHLTVEQVDAITGPFMGRPRSGSFRLNDLVGLDVMEDIARNLRERCPNDPFIGSLTPPTSLAALLERGWIGNKVRQGYYRKEGQELLALDLGTMAFRQSQLEPLPGIEALQSAPLPRRLAEGMDLKDETGEFMREYWGPVLRYADYLKEEISHNVVDFDNVMKWGFGWSMGPFETIDAIGPERLGISGGAFYSLGEYRAFSGERQAIPSDARYQQIEDYPVLDAKLHSELRDLGDGVLALVIKTKMGILDPELIAELHAWLDSGLDGFVLTSSAKAFSAGFDLKRFQANIAVEDWHQINQDLIALQTLGERLETRRCVAAIYRFCLGGGFEIARSCPVIVSDSETVIGIPETKVGLLPAGRGTTLLRLAHQHSARSLAEVGATMIRGVVSDNADHARVLGYLRASDVTCYHPDRLIYDAKQMVSQIVVTPRPAWKIVEGPISGMIDRTIDEDRKRGILSEYDAQLGEHIRQILTKCVSYEDAVAKEREEFLELCTKALSQARLRHMIETNKPLRN